MSKNDTLCCKPYIPNYIPKMNDQNQKHNIDNRYT